MTSDVRGYTFRADIWCPICMELYLETNHGITSANAESMLDDLAEAWGIDRMDEYSFDSCDGPTAFPKVILRFDMEDIEECGICGAEFS